MQVRSAKSGEYLLGGIDPGAYVLQVEADGFAKTYSKSFTIGEGERQTQVVEVTMNEGATIVGAVSDAAGKPIAGVSVVTLDDTHVDNPLTAIFGAIMPVRITKASAVTDGSGRFALERLTPGKYQLRFDHREYSRAYRKGFAVDDGQKLDTGITRLDPGSELSGYVLAPDGKAAAAATVNLSRHDGVSPVFETTLTDANGAFRFERRLPPGKYEVTARRIDQSVNQQQADIEKSRKEVSLTRGRQTVTIQIQPQ